METILRGKVRRSLTKTLTFAVGIVLLYCCRSGSLYLDYFLASALFLIVIKVCMGMYVLYWVSEMISIWDKGSVEIQAEKHEVK
jgi:L-asparagine transporter-like permease